MGGNRPDVEFGSVESIESIDISDCFENGSLQGTSWETSALDFSLIGAAAVALESICDNIS